MLALLSLDTAQEYAVMQQAVAELFEAGFLGLELCLAAVPGFPNADAHHLPQQMVHGHHLSDISRNLGSMSLRPAGGHVTSLDPSGAFQHHR